MQIQGLLPTRSISRAEKGVLLALAACGVVFHQLFMNLLRRTSWLWSDDVTVSDHMRLIVWVTFFSWVYGRVLFSFRSKFRFLAILPLGYYGLVMLAILEHAVSQMGSK